MTADDIPIPARPAVRIGYEQCDDAIDRLHAVDRAIAERILHKERAELILGLKAYGFTWEQIAALMGRSSRQAVQAIVKWAPR